MEDKTLKHLEMENNLVVGVKKVSINIPNDLSFSILSKLSVKTLKRFECVCKSWTLLFQISYFMSLFCKNLYNHSYYDYTSLLLHLYHKTTSSDVLYSLSDERFENKIKLDWPNPFQRDDLEFDILGSHSINGILCLISYSQIDTRLVLWNPATEEFKVVPTSFRESVPYMDIEITRYGFGYDSDRDDYKVIRQIMYNPNSDSESDIDDLSLEDIYYQLFWEIYSLQSNTWKKLDSNIPHNYIDQVLCLSGMCHWWGEEGYDNENYDEAYLLSFDLSKEEFLITPIPEDNFFRSRHHWEDLVVLNGCIALISNHNKNYPSDDIFHISILGEVGVKESWIKFCTIWPFPFIEHPIGVGKNGYMFLREHSGKLVCFNINTQMVEELGFVGHGFQGRTIIYERSIVPIGGMNI
ncbi:F-box/kelch-repeat protein At3g06240-like [Vicia villosa]|uniref:F-box/kelch-repeat protein At3g06240-like n=1 Tax=Vicia villosa TaxID=3911 RepID=UPI00273B5B0A|nr:F-box/kelch-repeat protein At3g06240-like [Vicia villosa]